MKTLDITTDGNTSIKKNSLHAGIGKMETLCFLVHCIILPYCQGKIMTVVQMDRILPAYPRIQAQRNVLVSVSFSEEIGHYIYIYIYVVQQDTQCGLNE